MESGFSRLDYPDKNPSSNPSIQLIRADPIHPNKALDPWMALRLIRIIRFPNLVIVAKALTLFRVIFGTV